MLIIVISEDKLTMSMFSSFVKKFFHENILIKEINNLFNVEFQSFMLDVAIQESLRGKNILIKYKTKESLIIPDLPQFNKANLLVKFEGLYSLYPLILRLNGYGVTEEEILKKWDLFLKTG